MEQPQGEFLCTPFPLGNPFSRANWDGTNPSHLPLSDPSVLSCPLRWCWAPQHRGQPVQDLHGCSHRLCAAGVWAHGDVHQVREAHERVPHLPPVRHQGRARLQDIEVALGSGLLCLKASVLLGKGNHPCHSYLGDQRGPCCRRGKQEAWGKVLCSSHARLCSSHHRALHHSAWTPWSSLPAIINHLHPRKI